LFGVKILDPGIADFRDRCGWRGLGGCDAGKNRQEHKNEKRKDGAARARGVHGRLSCLMLSLFSSVEQQSESIAV
jgi:hypothetical protein